MFPDVTKQGGSNRSDGHSPCKIQRILAAAAFGGRMLPNKGGSNRRDPTDYNYALGPTERHKTKVGGAGGG